jgi:taurine dioxygenase
VTAAALTPAREARLDPADWPFRTRPLTPTLGAEIVGVDLAGEVDGALFASLYGAFLRHQVLLFRGQDVPPGRQVAFARHFGEVQVHVMNQYHADGHPELYYLSNLGPDGQPCGKHPDKGTLAWHTDGSWSRRTGQATIIYSDEVPAEGGETHFCDMYAAWGSLPPARQAELAPLRAVHNLDFSRTRRHGVDLMTEAQKRDKPPVDHPVVRTHPESGRRALFLGDHTEYIQGMDYEAGRALIEAANAEAIHPSRVYEHRWRPGDLVVWDNRCLLHRATEYDESRVRRVMRRCTVLGEVPQA